MIDNNYILFCIMDRLVVDVTHYRDLFKLMKDETTEQHKMLDNILSKCIHNYSDAEHYLRLVLSIRKRLVELESTMEEVPNQYGPVFGQEKWKIERYITVLN